MAEWNPEKDRKKERRKELRAIGGSNGTNLSMPEIKELLTLLVDEKDME